MTETLEMVDRRRRVLDLALATPGIVALAPVMGVTALLIRVNMGRPIFFLQERSGRDGQPFKVIKFRTMRSETGQGARPFTDEERLTSLGRVLRAASIDEVPQLLNVLRGDMALVGPRPLHVRYLSRYSPAQLRRLAVRPGITGRAQVSGRNSLSWDEKVQLDLDYIDARGVRVDITILMQTVLAVFLRRGISADGQATMPEFMGTEVAA